MRPIKEMLIKGASREIIDKEGLTPLDIVYKIELETDLTEPVKVELVNILGT
jgi:hypothetical protein